MRSSPGTLTNRCSESRSTHHGEVSSVRLRRQSGFGCHEEKQHSVKRAPDTSLPHAECVLPVIASRSSSFTESHGKATTRPV
jgi:hypothetical protein